MRISAESIARLHDTAPLTALASDMETELLVRLGGGDQGAPLFLVHPVGGGVGCYLPLVQALQPAYPVYGLRHPGLNGESPRLDLDTLAQRYWSAVRGLQRGRAYRLGGWSLGGVVATLVAARAEAAGEPADLLLLIDSPTVAADGSFNAGVPLHVAAEELDEVRLAALQDMARQEAALRSDPAALATMSAVQAANTEALAACRLTATVRAVHYVGAGSDWLDRGWNAVAREEFKQRHCTGNHYSIMEAPHVALLAQYCNEWFAEATAAIAAGA